MSIKQISKSKGFTLLELITVTLILGVLAVVAIRGFGTVQRKALCGRAKSDMREVAHQVELFMQFTPDGVDPDVIGDAGGWEKLIDNKSFSKVPEVSGGTPGQRYGVWSDRATGDIIVWSPLGPPTRPNPINGSPFGEDWPYGAPTNKFPCHVLEHQFSNIH